MAIPLPWSQKIIRFKQVSTLNHVRFTRVLKCLFCIGNENKIGNGKKIKKIKNNNNNNNNSCEEMLQDTRRDLDEYIYTRNSIVIFCKEIHVHLFAHS